MNNNTLEKDPSEIDEDRELYELAKKNVILQLALQIHAILTITINAICVVLNIITYTTYWWFYWPFATSIVLLLLVRAVTTITSALAAGRVDGAPS